MDYTPEEIAAEMTQMVKEGLLGVTEDGKFFLTKDGQKAVFKSAAEEQCPN